LHIFLNKMRLGFRIGRLAFTADLLCATAEIMGKSTLGKCARPRLRTATSLVAVKHLRLRRWYGA
jgi:hypothetical protein